MVQPSFEEVVRLDSLARAWAKVEANRGGPGGDGVTIGDFAATALARLNRLRLDALSGAYWPGPIRHLRVAKPDGGWRPLAVPCVADRVLQTAVATAFTPLFEEAFEPVSYGYRPNRSVAMAVARVAALRRQGFVWTVDADIKRYFENVRHEPLLARVGALAKDTRLVDLVALWLDHAEPKGAGLPQGSPLSPILANLYLDAADEALNNHAVRMVRFADDFVLLCKSERIAQKALADAQETLAELGLELNLEKTAIRAYGDTLKFLGRLFVRSLVLDAAAHDAEGEEPMVEAYTPATPPRDPLTDPENLGADSDRRLAPRLRTLYVYEDETLLTADGPCFVVRKQGAEQFRLPQARVDQIELGPEADVDARALRLASANEIQVTLCNGWSHDCARLEPADPPGSARLHLLQARAVLDPERRLSLARAIVCGRLANQRALLRRLNRRRKVAAVAAAATAIGASLRRLARADTPTTLMGYEGEAAAQYWPALGHCLEHGWRLESRARRPPPDPVNIVLSMLAMRLTNDLGSLTRKHGLHPGFGVLHNARDEKRPTLALDLIEIFRAPLVEGLALYLFNNRILKTEHFSDDGEAEQPRLDTTAGIAPPMRLSTEGARIVIRNYEAWLDRRVLSPFSNANVLWRGLMEDQINAMRFAIETETPLQTYLMDY